MTERTPTIEEQMAALRSLISLSRTDLMYSDQYLRGADRVLQAICTHERYVRMRREKQRLPEVSAELDRAVREGSWERVRLLAGEAARNQERVSRHAAILAIADVVYGPRCIEPDARFLGVTGIVQVSRSRLDAEIASLVASLRRLAAFDPQWAAFYRARAEHFARLQIDADGAEGAVLDPEHSRRRMEQALAKGDFHEVQRLAAALAADPPRPDGRVRVPSPTGDRVARLAESFPSAVEREASKLGLSSECLAARAELNSYLGCCCADRARFPTSPLTESHRQAEGCTCGHACPPQLPAALHENLDLLMVHPFITSAGTRYLPWFGQETLLVETFVEDGEHSGLLVEALGLPRRLGLPRMRIEDALARRGPVLCTDLGLDPVECAVVCIPYDAYLRLAAKYGWGRQQRWTHFDGYQVLQHAHLRALVGGDVRYGGPYDLCSVERHYDPERLVARFAIVRRDRFTVRDRGERPS